MIIIIFMICDYYDGYQERLSCYLRLMIIVMVIRWTDQVPAVLAGERSFEGLLSGCPPFKLGGFFSSSYVFFLVQVRWFFKAPCSSQMTFIGPRYTCRSIFLHPPISTLWLIDFEWCWLMLITSLMSEKQRITAVVAPMWLSPRTEVCLPPVDLTPGNIFIGRKCVSHFLFTGMYISPLSPLTSWNSDCQASSLENRGRRRGGRAAPRWRSLGKIWLDLRYQGRPTLRILFPLSFFFFSLFSSFFIGSKVCSDDKRPRF